MARRTLVPLKSLATVHAGYSPRPSERLQNGPYRFLTGRNLFDLGLRLFDHDDFLRQVDRPSFRRSLILEGDILVSTLFLERKLYIVRHADPPAIAGDSLAIIRPGEDTYLRDYLNTGAGRERFLQEAARKTGGTHLPRIGIRDLESIRIPLLDPREIQQLAESQLGLVGNELLSMIARGESTRQEFKSTLRKNLRTGQTDPRLEDAVLKTVAAFCNTDGGTLLIGVGDDGNVVGIEQDGFLNSDKFCQHLSNLLRDRLEPPPLGRVNLRVLKYSGRSACVLECQPTEREVWLIPEAKSAPELYFRLGPTSRALLGVQISDYFRRRLTHRATGS